MTQIIEVCDNLELALNKAIYEFRKEYEVNPHIIFGKKAADLLTPSPDWIVTAEEEGRVHSYKGISCEYEPDLDCVMLKG